jgi:putative chitinase
MTALTAAQIRALAPKARADLVAAIVDNWHEAEAAGITTPPRASHFLARVMVETGGLKAIEESLNYSVAGLRSTFGAHRITDAQCKVLGRSGNRKADQQGIANVVYGGAWGKSNLGNTKPGDGWLYRGSGLLQTTGRANFKALGFEANPDGLRDPAQAFLSAVKEWVKRGCNALADKDDVVAICKKINGGTNGLGEQREYLAKAKTIFGKGAAPKATPNPAVGLADITLDDAPAGYDLELEKTQTLLVAAGYPVGEIDGRWGEMTRTALRGFKAAYNDTTDDDLPLDNTYGKDVQLALIGFKRPVAEERATATASDLKKAGDPQVSFLNKARNWVSMILFGAPAVVGADKTGLLDQVEGAGGIYRRVSSALEPFAPLKDFVLAYWWVGAAAVGVFAVLYINRKIRTAVATYRAGLRA